MPLVDLAVGDRGEFLTCSLAKCDRQLLGALGFGERCKFRLCQARDPFIVKVRGTRIGIARDVARQLMVVREEPAATEATPAASRTARSSR